MTMPPIFMSFPKVNIEEFTESSKEMTKQV